jgi:3-oxoadipate enol-lactonase
MKIAYQRHGSGAPVLLIHGVGGDATNWDAVSAILRRRFDVIAMDLRGHGQSDPIEDDIDVHGLAQDALQVLDEAGVQRCGVVGFSLGGAVAMALALDHPERVQKLALIATVCGRTPDERERAKARIEFLNEHGIRAIAEANRERWFTDAFREAHPDIVDRRVLQLTSCDAASYRHAFSVFCTTDLVDRLDEIEAPALVITGEHDVAATPRMARLMGDGLPDATVHVLPNLRHSLLIEAPHEVSTLLDAFL